MLLAFDFNGLKSGNFSVDVADVDLIYVIRVGMWVIQIGPVCVTKVFNAAVPLGPSPKEAADSSDGDGTFSLFRDGRRLWVLLVLGGIHDFLRFKHPQLLVLPLVRWL